jgi:hypothetical protein
MHGCPLSRADPLDCPLPQRFEVTRMMKETSSVLGVDIGVRQSKAISEAWYRLDTPGAHDYMPRITQY